MVVYGNMNKTAELSLLLCLPENVLPHVQKGRLQNKLIKLQEAVDTEFNIMPYINKEEKEKATAKITEFGNTTGWDRKEKHPVTLVSFLLEMIENSEFTYRPKITEILNDIFAYYERGKQAYTACCTAGKTGHKKWDELS